LIERNIDRELVPAIEAYGMGLLPFFPLASGLLTGKYDPEAAPAQGTRLGNNKAMADRWLTDDNWSKVTALQKFGTVRWQTLLELACRGPAARPGVGSYFAGATRPEQMEACVKAIVRALITQDMGDIDRITAVV